MLKISSFVSLVLMTAVGVTTTAAQTPVAGNAFAQTNLVADNASFNPQIVDPNMIDAWGIALRPPGAGGHIWVDNAGTGTSDEFIGDVGGVPLHQDGLTSVQIHAPQFTDHGYAYVTGIVYNAAKDLTGQAVEFAVPPYNVSHPGQVIQTGDATQPGQPAQNDTTPGSPVPITGGTTGASAFIFVTEDGCINCWRSNTQVAMTDTPLVVDYSKAGPGFPYEANSVFSGAAITVNASSSQTYINAGGNHLFATDFRNNVILVFDHAWKDVTSSYQFQTPATVGGLHPFNIHDINGHLYVAYAMFNTAGDEGMEQTNGAGYGHVVEYNEDGTLAKDFNDQGMLNAPWGMAIAPAGFGKFGGDLLVANFGDGTVTAFDPNTGNYIDKLRDQNGNLINVDGIWGLTFGNGVSLGDANSLYFTAGPNSEYDGLFGKLTVVVPATDTPAMPLVALLVLAVLLVGVAGLSQRRTLYFLLPFSKFSTDIRA